MQGAPEGFNPSDSLIPRVQADIIGVQGGGGAMMSLRWLSEVKNISFQNVGPDEKLLAPVKVGASASAISVLTAKTGAAPVGPIAPTAVESGASTSNSLASNAIPLAATATVPVESGASTSNSLAPTTTVPLASSTVENGASTSNSLASTAIPLAATAIVPVESGASTSNSLASTTIPLAATATATVDSGASTSNSLASTTAVPLASPTTVENGVSTSNPLDSSTTIENEASTSNPLAATVENGASTSNSLAATAAVPLSSTTVESGAPTSNPLTSSSLINAPPLTKKPIDLKYFDPQDPKSLSCGRNALNNLLGNTYFSKDGPIITDLKKLSDPISLKQLCNYMSKKTGLADLVVCNANENYEGSMLEFALGIIGHPTQIIGNTILHQDPLTKSFTYNETNPIIIGYIINLGDLKMSGSAINHWVALRKNADNTFTYLDSLNNNFSNKPRYNSLNDYLNQMHKIYYGVLTIISVSQLDTTLNTAKLEETFLEQANNEKTAALRLKANKESFNISIITEKVLQTKFKEIVNIVENETQLNKIYDILHTEHINDTVSIYKEQLLSVNSKTYPKYTVAIFIVLLYLMLKKELTSYEKLITFYITAKEGQIIKLHELLNSANIQLTLAIIETDDEKKAKVESLFELDDEDPTKIKFKNANTRTGAFIELFIETLKLDPHTTTINELNTFLDPYKVEEIVEYIRQGSKEPPQEVRIIELIETTNDKQVPTVKIGLSSGTEIVVSILNINKLPPRNKLPPKKSGKPFESRSITPSRLPKDVKAFMIGGHGSQNIKNQTTFTVPPGCIIIAKGIPGQVTNTQHLSLICKNSIDILKDPLNHLEELYNNCGSIAIYKEGDICPNFHYTLTTYYSGSMITQNDSGILDLSVLVKNRKECEDLYLNLTNIKGINKNRLTSATYMEMVDYIVSLYKYSLYPKSIEIREILLQNKINIQKAADYKKLWYTSAKIEYLIVFINKLYHIYQKQLCQSQAGIYYNFVCKWDEAVSPFIYDRRNPYNKRKFDRDNILFAPSMNQKNADVAEADNLLLQAEISNSLHKREVIERASIEPINMMDVVSDIQRNIEAISVSSTKEKINILGNNIRIFNNNKYTNVLGNIVMFLYHIIDKNVPAIIDRFIDLYMQQTDHVDADVLKDILITHVNKIYPESSNNRTILTNAINQAFTNIAKSSFKSSFKPNPEVVFKIGDTFRMKGGKAFYTITNIDTTHKRISFINGTVPAVVSFNDITGLKGAPDVSPTFQSKFYIGNRFKSLIGDPTATYNIVEVNYPNQTIIGSHDSKGSLSVVNFNQISSTWTPSINIKNITDQDTVEASKEAEWHTKYDSIIALNPGDNINIQKVSEDGSDLRGEDPISAKIDKIENDKYMGVIKRLIGRGIQYTYIAPQVFVKEHNQTGEGWNSTVELDNPTYSVPNGSAKPTIKSPSQPATPRSGAPSPGQGAFLVKKGGRRTRKQKPKRKSKRVTL